MKLFSKKVMGLCLLLIGFAVNAKEYYIQGTLEGTFVDGEYVTKLLNPVGNGIDFSYESEVLGEEAERGQYSFRFRNATTECSNGFKNGLKFYRKENGKWQEDSEVDQSTALFRSDRTMEVVLVLDCSSSLEDQIDIVQESAKEFISLLAEKTEYRGNIHVGIVAFNYRQIVSDIVPLTASNVIKLKNFIESLDGMVNNNTALYGAIDLGINMMENYVVQNGLKNFDGAILVAFTDGLDNASLKAEKNITSPSQYLEYLRPIVKSKFIEGKRLNSYVVAVKGKDVKDDIVFDDNLKPLATSEKNYYLLDDMTLLKQKFRSIADGLVTRWMDLICYVPPTGQGDVRWVLECTSKPTPKKKGISEIGAVVGGINGFSSKFINGKFAYQLDLGMKFLNYTSYVEDLHMSYEYLAYVLDLSQNFMFQDNVREWQNGTLFWFLGGGINIGCELYYLNTLKLGANGMVGLEYMFAKAPITLQLDFRPGYARVFEWNYYWDSYTNSYMSKIRRSNLFEWTIGLSVRYYF